MFDSNQAEEKKKKKAPCFRKVLLSHENDSQTFLHLNGNLDCSISDTLCPFPVISLKPVFWSALQS